MTFAPLNKRKYTAALLAGFVWNSPIVAYAADGKALLDEWVVASQASPFFDLSYANARESGSLLTVDALEVSISGLAMLQYMSEQLNLEAVQFDEQLAAGSSYTISWPTITINGLSDEGDQFSARALNADSVEIRTMGDGPSSSTQTINELSIEDLTIAKWPEIEEAADRPISKFIPLIKAMVSIDLSSMSVQSVATVVEAEDGVEVSQSYGPLAVGPVAGGDISNMTASNFAMTVTSPGEETPLFEFSADQFTANNYNYATTLNQFLAPANEGADFQQSVGKMALKGIRFAAVEEEFAGQVENLELTGIGVRPASLDVFAKIDALLVEALTTNREPSDEEIVELLAAIYGAFSLKSFQINDVALQGQALSEFGLGSFFISDFSSAGLGEIGLTNLFFNGADGEEIRLEKHVYEDMTFPSLIAMIGLEEALQNQDVPAILEAIPTLGRVVQTGLVIKAPNENVDVALDSSIFEMRDHVGPIPTGLRLGIDGLRMDVDALEPEEREPFESLGLETIVLTSDTLVQWERETENVNLDVLISAEQLGTLSGEGTVGSVPASVFDQPSAISLFALTGATFDQISLRFDDDGLVERAIAYGAAEEGLEYGDMELRLKGMIPVFLSELDDPALANQLAQSLTAVIERGASLSLTVTAKSPLPIAILSAVSDPAVLATMFDIEIENP
ncbi:MAG: hypothetical protein AAFY99_04100 [Pseudomonadota bacterium]